MEPRVSAIIIFLNEHRFLAQAIESVLAQTFTDWELVLVDDGSTDGSSDIARRYAEQYPGRIRYVEHPGHENRGMSASRNLGVRHARGAFIAFLDGDDMWFPNKLEHQLALFENYPEAEMVYGPLLCWHSWTGTAEDSDKDFLYGLDDIGVHVEGNILIHPPRLLSLFLLHEPFIPAGVMLRRRVWEEVGGAEESFRGNYEDAVLQTKICLRSPVYLSNECTYRYRIHPDSCARQALNQGTAERDREVFLNWVDQYFKRQRVSDRDLWRTLRRALRPYRSPTIHRLLASLQATRRGAESLARGIARTVLPFPLRARLRKSLARYNNSIQF